MCHHHTRSVNVLPLDRQATISDLNVTLKQVEIAETSPPEMQQPYKEKQEQKSSPPAKSTQPEIRSPGEATVAKIVESTQIVTENLPDKKELSDSIVPATKSRKAKRRESEILTTPAESTWTQPVVKTPIEHDDQDISNEKNTAYILLSTRCYCTGKSSRQIQ